MNLLAENLMETFGRMVVTIDEVNETILVDYSGVSESQRMWAGRSQGYPEGSPIPVVPWIFRKRIEDLSRDTRAQYLAETADSRIADAEALADFAPE